MSVPTEFFTEEELAAILETPQPSRQREILASQNVPFIVSAAGRPRVYRDRLIPSTVQAQNDASFDFSTLARRPPKNRSQS